MWMYLYDAYDNIYIYVIYMGKYPKTFPHLLSHPFRDPNNSPGAGKDM